MNTAENEPRHVHIHLGDLGHGETHVHIHAGTSANGAAAGPAAEPEDEPTVEASLRRLKDWDSANAKNIQAAYDGLAALGCVPHRAGRRDPRPGAYVQPYIRWTHPRHPGGSVGFLNAATLTVAGKNDVPRVAGLPGAVTVPRGGEIRFAVTSPERVRQALAAVKVILGDG